MKKSDIQYHGTTPSGHNRLPAVNVKCSLFSGDFTDDKLRPPAVDVLGEDRVDEFLEWWHAQEADVVGTGFYPDSALDKLINTWWGMACQQGWELLQEQAEQAFPDHDVKTWSEGRSGGWCVVDGLPPVRTWDAIMVSRWARFVKWCGEVVADIPYQITWMIAVNIFEPILIERDQAADDDTAARLPILLNGD